MKSGSYTQSITSLLFILPAKKRIFFFHNGKVPEVASRQKPLTLMGFLSNKPTILMHKTGSPFPEPGLRTPETVWIRDQSWGPSLTYHCVSPHKEGMQWGRHHTICSVQTKQFDSANTKVQLCCGRQMHDHKN